jgi:hypothetical protein
MQSLSSHIKTPRRSTRDQYHLPRLGALVCHFADQAAYWAMLPVQQARVFIPPERWGGELRARIKTWPAWLFENESWQAHKLETDLINAGRDPVIY